MNITNILSILFNPLLVDGAWTDWSSWGTCDVSCDIGHMTRTRTCTEPTPENGGLDCVGSPTDTKNCNLRTCPSKQFRVQVYRQCFVFIVLNNVHDLLTPMSNSRLVYFTGIFRQ